MSELELFYWRRADDGYEWIDGKAETTEASDQALREETRFLAPRNLYTAKLWRYNPLVASPTLYREFASTPHTEEGYLSFANAYGDLGTGVLLNQSGPIVFYDPLYTWHLAHARVRPVVDVLNAIQSNDVATLRQWFTLMNNGARYRRDGPEGISLATVTMTGGLREHLWTWATEAPSENEAILRIARGWAQGEINEGMEGKSQPESISSARVIFDVEKKSMTMRVTPHSLLGAIWLQCARMLTLNPAFRECAHCAKWFELSPDTRRRQSKYCSDRCKVAAYRRRKEQAAGVEKIAT